MEKELRHDISLRFCAEQNYRQIELKHKIYTYWKLEKY